MLDLNATQREIEEINRANGWYDEERPWSADVALLHSEVSEMLEAYRDHGLADATGEVRHMQHGPVLPKPEGVGSETADVLIRLLDTAGRYGIAGDEVGQDPELTIEEFGGFRDFTEAVNLLHVSATSISTSRGRDGEALPAGGDFFDTREAMRNTYGLLVSTCAQYDIDLEVEVTRKLAYNRTRSHRHGGRIL